MTMHRTTDLEGQLEVDRWQAEEEDTSTTNHQVVGTPLEDREEVTLRILSPTVEVAIQVSTASKRRPIKVNEDRMANRDRSRMTVSGEMNQEMGPIAINECERSSDSVLPRIKGYPRLLYCHCIA